jgi:hypothetical protein
VRRGWGQPPVRRLCCLVVVFAARAVAIISATALALLAILARALTAVAGFTRFAGFAGFAGGGAGGPEALVLSQVDNLVPGLLVVMGGRRGMVAVYAVAAVSDAPAPHPHSRGEVPKGLGARRPEGQ